MKWQWINEEPWKESGRKIRYNWRFHGMETILFQNIYKKTHITQITCNIRKKRPKHWRWHDKSREKSSIARWVHVYSLRFHRFVSLLIHYLHLHLNKKKTIICLAEAPAIAISIIYLSMICDDMICYLFCTFIIYEVNIY